mmetsp:Transcript_22824/g.63771  ORF Transcript_22824/g.63771 Transcript_22824/m.63771 type:complete len:216 (-) Transcript_22824:876-1523(-)
MWLRSPLGSGFASGGLLTTGRRRGAGPFRHRGGGARPSRCEWGAATMAHWSAATMAHRGAATAARCCTARITRCHRRRRGWTARLCRLQCVRAARRRRWKLSAITLTQHRRWLAGSSGNTWRCRHPGRAWSDRGHLCHERSAATVPRLRHRGGRDRALRRCCGGSCREGRFEKRASPGRTEGETQVRVPCSCQQAGLNGRGAWASIGVLRYGSQR